MSEGLKYTPGHIGWVDIVYRDPEAARRFYTGVVGWHSTPVDMGPYVDYNMTSGDSADPIAGICHVASGLATGELAERPPFWMVYIAVDDIEAAATQVPELGGKVLAGPSSMGDFGRYLVVEDPGGAVVTLYSAPS